MPRAFKWLPFVDNCCVCVRDLRIATYMITIYSIMKSLSIVMNKIWPMCPNLRGDSGIGLMVFVVDMIQMGIAMILFSVTLLMGVTTKMNKPVVKPFIILIYIEIAFSLFVWVLYIIRMQDVNMVCRGEYYNGTTYTIHRFSMFPQLFLEILIATIFTYYTIVVNSFAVLWDRYGGNIPPPEMPETMGTTIIIYTPPRPGQGGQRNVPQDYPGLEEPQQPRRPAREGVLRPNRLESPKEQPKTAQVSNTPLQDTSLELRPQINLPAQELQEKFGGFFKLGSTRLKRTHEQRKTKQEHLQLKRNIADHKPADISLKEQAFLLQGFLPNLPPTIQTSPIKPLSQLAYSILNSTLKKPIQGGSTEPVEPQLLSGNAGTEQVASERGLPTQD